MREIDTTRAFLQLYEYEYGQPLELLLRFSILTVATLLFTQATGWIIGVAWLAIYYPLHLANFLYFRLRIGRPTEFDITVVSGLFLVLIAAFLWLPGYLLLQESLSMQLAGAAAILGTVLWLIRRSELSIRLLISEIILMGLCMGVLLAFAVPMIETTPERIAVILCGVGVVIYFALTMLMSRKHHQRAEEAASRAAEAEKMKALGHLAGGVAHDFNNILTATIGNLELYEEVRTEAEQAQCVEEALLAARSGEALVRKLLAFGRAPVASNNTIALNDVVDGLQTLSKRLLPAPIRLTVTVPQRGLVVPVSGQDLTTALLNLIVNARDAMTEGGSVSVTITPHSIRQSKMMLDGSPIKPGDYVRIDVADNGPGMAPDVLQRVLEPFFTTKPEGKGSGLGLPLVAEFAREAGGGLIITTSPYGTCVTIYLPSMESAGPVAEATAA